MRETDTTICQHDAEDLSAYDPALGGLHVRRRTKRVPAVAFAYMFHVTDRPRQGVDKVRCRKTPRQEANDRWVLQM